MVSLVEANYRLIDEIKHIIINLKRSKKIFDPIVHSSSETVQLYIIKHKRIRNEIVSIENRLFYPYNKVKDKYEKLLEEHENCEKRLLPILIKTIMNKQERQQENFINVYKLEISLPRIDSTLLFDPPIVGDSKLIFENEPDRKPYASEIKPDNNHILSIINWSAPEMMQKNALYTQECENFSFIMLLWELAFQRIPYENMNKEDIIDHVTRGRRESLYSPFFTLDFLNVQKKYLRIIADGWDDKPYKRIRLDNILLEFSDIEAKLTKLRRNNFGCFYSSDRLDNPYDESVKETLKNLEPEKKPRSVFGSDAHDDAFTISKEYHKTDIFIAVQDSVSSERYKEIVSKQRDDGSIELDDVVCNELEVLKEEIITAIQENVTNEMLKLSELPSLFSTAINLSYLKNTASKFEDQWKDKYNKAREYLSKQIGNAAAEKELLEFTDNYVIDNYAKKAIKDKKKSSVVRVQTSLIPDKHEAVVSKEDRPIELYETICKEIEDPTEDINTHRMGI
ncbi:4098_t:CDS:2 [Dentiscutata erythropus]|uniref:4098_t:CDS:1 n=1 Tax=Dentiscutata erythropus TaxID=1348616 RepID=A0A9N8YSA2_9GLOM|nr:4098_t:CDS:2 [Dentiscutata erythropus]